MSAGEGGLGGGGGVGVGGDFISNCSKCWPLPLWAEQQGLCPGMSGKRTKEMRKKGSAVLMKSLLPKTKCALRLPPVWVLLTVSGYSLCHDLQDHPTALQMFHRFTHIHTHTPPGGSAEWNRHFLSLTHAYPLPSSCITFSHDLTLSSQLVLKHWMNEECSFCLCRPVSKSCLW